MFRVYRFLASLGLLGRCRRLAELSSQHPMLARASDCVGTANPVIAGEYDALVVTGRQQLALRLVRQIPNDWKRSQAAYVAMKLGITYEAGRLLLARARRSAQRFRDSMERFFDDDE